MSEDRLLRDLGQLAREREAEEAARLDERWDRLSHGALSPEEEAELRALAESSPEAHEAYEAFRPLGPDFQAGVVQKLQQARAKETPPARVLPFRRLTSRIAGWGALAASVAAAVLIVFLRAPAPLPEYASLGVTGGSSAYRGETGEARAFAPGDRVQVVLQPRTAASGAPPLEAGCFLVRDGEARRLEVRSEIEPSGSIRMTGRVPADVRPGGWTLWAVAGRAGDLPGPEEIRSQAGREVRQRDWVALAREVRIRPRSE
jgi:hypothetical protein